MKTTTHSLMVALAAALFLLAPLATWAQVAEVSGVPSKKEIVRSLDGRYSIAYSNDAGLNCFVLDDPYTQPLRFSLPATMLVNDIEVDGDNVFFCGSMGPHGMIGHFDWKKVFWYNDRVYFTVCNSDYSSEGHYIHIDNYTRMDYFYDITSGRHVLALVGNSVVDDYLLLNRTVVAAASTTTLYPPSSWAFRYLYNKDGKITYTDIAALDRSVVAVGHHDGRGCYLRTFKKDDIFPSHPYDTAFATEILLAGVPAVGPSLVEGIAPDVVTVVHQGTGTTTVGHRLFVDPSTGAVSSAANSYYFTTLSALSSFDLYDLRFDKELYLLEDADHLAAGVTSRWLDMLPTTTSPAAIDCHRLLIGRQTTLDVNPQNLKPITAGSSPSGLLSMYRPLNIGTTTTCSVHHSLGLTYLYPTKERLSVSFNDPSQNYTSLPPFLPVIINATAPVICP